MIDRSTKLTVTLDAASWDAVLNVLADGQYRVTAPLIADIQRQCIGQRAPNEPESYTSPAPPLRNNGKARAAAATSEPSA